MFAQRTGEIGLRMALVLKGNVLGLRFVAGRFGALLFSFRHLLLLQCLDRILELRAKGRLCARKLQHLFVIPHLKK